MFLVVNYWWRKFLILGVDSFEAVVARREERNSCSCWGVVVFVEKEGVQLLVLQKWVSRIQIVLSDRVEWSCQDFRFIQWCIDFVELERDYVHSQLFIEWRHSVWLICVKREVTRIRKWVQHRSGHCYSSMGSLLRRCFRLSNPVRVVTSATNQYINHSRVLMSSSFHPPSLRVSFNLRSLLTLFIK